MKNEQLTLTLNLPPTETDFINKINSMMKELDKKIKKHPAGSLESLPLYFEKRRLLRIKQRIEREGIYNY